MDTQTRLVLVADDDAEVRDALAQVLDAHGFRAASAVDGQHALEHLAQGVTPCAILLDWMMPRVDGEEFLRTRARSGFLSGIPVIVISASHAPTADPRIQGFLAKPFGVSDLLTMLREVCEPHFMDTRRLSCLPLTERKEGAQGTSVL